MAVSNIVWHDGDEHPYMMGPDKNYRGYVVRAVFDDGNFEIPAEPNSPDNPSGEINGYGYVEMGDGLKWAIVNVGVSQTGNEYERGSYFHWGDIVPHTGDEHGIWNASAYKWWSEEKGTYTKYQPDIITLLEDDVEYISSYNAIVQAWYDSDLNFIGDNKTELDIEDDAARQIMGATWRIPSASEFETLTDESKFEWEWTEDYKGSGVNGMIVTSLIPGYKGNYIFLPCTGYSPGGDNNMHMTNERARYWANNVEIADSYGMRAGLLGFDQSHLSSTSYQRYLGAAIKAVSE